MESESSKCKSPGQCGKQEEPPVQQLNWVRKNHLRHCCNCLQAERIGSCGGQSMSSGWSVNIEEILA